MNQPRTEETAGGLPRGYLRPCLLLLLAESPGHGYDLLERVRALGLERIDTAGLYRALRAMEQEGLVTSAWQHSDSGPARRTYSPAREGLDWLHVWAISLRDVERSLGRYLDRYASLADRAPIGGPR